MSTSLDIVRTNKNLVFFKCQQLNVVREAVTAQISQFQTDLDHEAVVRSSREKELERLMVGGAGKGLRVITKRVRVVDSSARA